jgi:hypothetical protein
VRREIRDDQRFALWRWQDLRFQEGLYLRKLYLWRTPWHQAALHWIYMGDPGRDLHDHPRDFVSIVLRGGYAEERPERTSDGRIRWRDRLTPICRTSLRGPLSVVYRRAQDPHRIAVVLPGTLTLVLWGRKRRHWGFHTFAGWVRWEQYCGVDPVARRTRPSILDRARAWWRR